MALVKYALTDLERVKEFLPTATEASIEDGKLRDLINSVTDRFERFAQTKLKKRTYKPSGADASAGEENLKLNGNDRLSSVKFLLPNPPIHSITSVVIRDKKLTVIKTVELATDLVFDPNSGIVELIDGDVWERGFQNIDIEYEGGFSPIPQDLEHSCVVQVIHDFYRTDRNRLGITSVNIQGETIQFENKDLLTQVVGVLKGYRLPSLN